MNARISIAVALVFFAMGARALRAGAPRYPDVVVVELGRLLEGHPRVQAVNASIPDLVGAERERHHDRLQKLYEISERMAEYKTTSDEYKKLHDLAGEALLDTRLAQLRFEREIVEKQIAANEQALAEIKAEIEAFQKEVGVAIVLSTGGPIQLRRFALPKRIPTKISEAVAAIPEKLRYRWVYGAYFPPAATLSLEELLTPPTMDLPEPIEQVKAFESKLSGNVVSVLLEHNVTAVIEARLKKLAASSKDIEPAQQGKVTDE